MSRASLLRLCLLACIWGSSFLFIKLALAGLSPVQIVLARLTAGAAVLLAAVLLRRQPLPRAPVVWGHLALMGVIANIFPFFLFGWGEQRITSGLAGVLNGTTPLFTLVIALAALPEERWSPARGAGLLLGFAGVLLVVGPWNVDPATSSPTGQLACLAAAGCYGIGFVYSRRFLTGRGLSPLGLSAGQLSVAALILGLVSPLVAPDPVRLDWVVVGSVLALGAFGTGLAYLLYYRLIADAGATSASMVTYLIPVVAVVLGIGTLGEPVTWNLFAGAATVILGVALSEGRLGRWGRRPPPRPTVDAPVAVPRESAPPPSRL
ncbi:MAG: DMT family transporter [Actinomycetota bacterium]|nr:DMT family transporter [Actinomycetota bacterium]